MNFREYLLCAWLIALSAALHQYQQDITALKQRLESLKHVYSSADDQASSHP